MKRFTTTALVVGALLVAGCDVDVNDKGKMPAVKVEPGRAPDVDVRGPDVDINTKKTEVTVPDVDVKTEKKTITVPDIDVKIPKEDDK